MIHHKAMPRAMESLKPLPWWADKMAYGSALFGVDRGKTYRMVFKAALRLGHPKSEADAMALSAVSRHFSRIR